MAIKVLTKYILSPMWIRLIVFTFFYLIIIKLHYYEIEYTPAECMPRKFSKDKIFIVSTADEKGPLEQASDRIASLKAKGRNLDFFSEEIVNINLLPAKIIDENFLHLAKKQEQMEHFLVKHGLPSIAESKDTSNEVKESFEDFVVNKISDSEARINLHLSQLEEQQNKFKEQLDLAATQRRWLYDQSKDIKNDLATQIVQTKSQQELIEHIQKKFKRKLQTQNQLINDLQQENQQLRSQLNILERKVNDLISQRYPGAQTTNPFVPLRK